MLSIEYKSSISEVLDIINNMEDIYREKISTKFMEFLVKNQNENYKSYEPQFWNEWTNKRKENKGNFSYNCI